MGVFSASETHSGGEEMKLMRIAAMPFALLADVVSCGNIGGNRSFTQQVMDAEKRERDTEEAVKLLKLLIEASK